MKLENESCRNEERRQRVVEPNDRVHKEERKDREQPSRGEPNRTTTKTLSEIPDNPESPKPGEERDEPNSRQRFHP